MNYRHIYHAGNFADVWKHLVLVALLDALKQKDKAFCYLDTHAGIGRYNLDAEQARKTAEADQGIGRLSQHTHLPELLQRYLQLVEQCRAEQPQSYPGSPWLAAMLRRPQDSLILNELHPEDQQQLTELFKGQRQVSLRREDAYQSLQACLPPTEKRGLVLIDPPFEQDNEFKKLAEAIQKAHKRWPTGCYAIWYPIKDRREVMQLHRRLTLSGIRKILLAELHVKAAEQGVFSGSGMLIINPPWQLQERLQPAGEWLRQTLGQDDQAKLVLEWLVPE
ncbi:23S rRNA (adenine(2030)-N(6))-methyltransferase RlmJ [Balneatrix alpica]|uniref:Ribosomal RNA large subunit methyltransferase J n=1 Tax=Balneatrix alpica TaxID=75684 RepID=A0ABV5ZAY2_9GAMM|nr:23S rRNA (adenine(2030)-N(6))-methyltransferase RlmJ [Balneatrix alpica]